MAKEVTNDMFDKLLEESGSQLFFHKEGKVTLVFKSPIKKTNPGETDIMGRIWNPPLTDANGNPVLDRNNQPRQPWAKFEAEVLMDGMTKVYSFGGPKTSLLTNFAAAMKREDVDNKNLPGTKWSIEKIGKWDWMIKYLGTEDKPSTPSPNVDPKIVDALHAKKDQSSGGLDKGSIVAYLAFVTGISASEVETKIIPSLTSGGYLKLVSGKYFIQ